MAALIASRDAEVVAILSRVLQTRGIGAEHCDDLEAALARVSEQRFVMLLVDSENEAAAIDFVIQTRATAPNSTTLIVALVDSRNETRELFERGVNFVMYKPISAERAGESLQAAWSLLPRDRRKKERTHVSSQASITFATTENAPVPLLNLSEDGIAIHSQNKMPPPCRVYFQFALPGQPAAVRLSAEVIWQDWRGRVGLHLRMCPKPRGGFWMSGCAKIPIVVWKTASQPHSRLNDLCCLRPNQESLRPFLQRPHRKTSAGFNRVAHAVWV